MARKLNNETTYESIGKFRLSKEKTPVAFEEKVSELMEEEEISREDAERYVADMEFELEIYYDKGFGLFAVEADAIECGTKIASPYSMNVYEPFDREEDEPKEPTFEDRVRKALDKAEEHGNITKNISFNEVVYRWYEVMSFEFDHEEITQMSNELVDKSDEIIKDWLN